MRSKAELEAELEAIESKMQNEHASGGPEFDYLMAAKDAIGWALGHYSDRPSTLI